MMVKGLQPESTWATILTPVSGRRGSAVVGKMWAEKYVGGSVASGGEVSLLLRIGCLTTYASLKGLLDGELRAVPEEVAVVSGA
jgi:hypothetical protein